MKGDRIEESLKLSDLIIFISTFVYRESIRRFENSLLQIVTLLLAFFYNGINLNDAKHISLLSFSLSLSICAAWSPQFTQERERDCFGLLMVLMLIHSGISNWQIVYSPLFSSICLCNLFKTTFFSNRITSHNSLYLSLSHKSLAVTSTQASAPSQALKL